MAQTTSRAGRPWRGVAPQDRDAQRRARLIDAGLEVFGTTGYQASTVSGLCAAAGVSTRSFYELFSHRSALLEAVYVQICDDVQTRIVGLGAPGDDVSAWIRAAVEQVLGPLLKDVRTIRIIEVEMVGVSAELEETRRRTTKSIAEALSLVQVALSGEGSLTLARRALLGVFLEGGMSEALVAFARDELAGPVTAEDFLDELSTIVEHLLAV
ncbi:TetR/AcrR family transcriptional regulator [Luteipulveratus mongoliensis]|uniref:TetR/AcrR family transcriptional regulator n=1 Tax=Luteipulveratus mongoliensis TaxID=571913 RepID=UPI000695BC13|nr:TetR/AcrR family transcriptional regulator [Luteipulveratus mongoliensis]